MYESKKDAEVYGRTLFGAAIFNAALPVKVIADIIGVKRQTVYGWIKGGKDISYSHGIACDTITTIINKGIAQGILPALNSKTAKEWLQEQYDKTLDINVD